MNTPLVTITGMDTERSSPSGEGALVDVHLNITTPPSGWISLFDQIWNQHIYMMKRHAHANTTHIVIRCIPDELKNSHIPELKKVIAETDAAYQKSHQNAERQKQILEEKEKRFRDDLKNVADNLEL